MRATLQDLARDPDLRLAGVVARLLTPAARVLRDAAGFRGIGFMSGGPPIGRPLPHIADHVVEPVAVWRERFDGRGALAAIGLQVLVREAALPGIRLWPPCGVNSPPQANSAPSRPPRAATSHSASVGNSLPAHLPQP